MSCFGTGRDPAKHVALLALQPLDRAVWKRRLQTALENSREPEALVYIHGYKSSFDEAARRAAQLAFDLSFPGVPILYSWPSKDDLTDYVADFEAVEETTFHLADFLTQVARNTGARRVHVVAHSLGNRALTNALQVMAMSPGAPGFSNLVLTAPDVSARLFEEHIGPRIMGFAERVTLYASSLDKALRIAERLRQSRRLGQAGETILVLEGMDTIDASRVDTDWIGHGYIATTKQVIDDLFMLLRHDLPPADRNLEQVKKGDLVYWALR
jgi:esterase/lipase superfamily enzyme